MPTLPKSRWSALIVAVADDDRGDIERGGLGGRVCGGSAAGATSMAATGMEMDVENLDMADSLGCEGPRGAAIPASRSEMLYMRH
jgi:hypothetical protein